MESERENAVSLMESAKNRVLGVAVMKKRLISPVHSLRHAPVLGSMCGCVKGVRVLGVDGIGVLGRVGCLHVVGAVSYAVEHCQEFIIIVDEFSSLR
jgi:hypothetical protein